MPPKSLLLLLAVLSLFRKANALVLLHTALSKAANLGHGSSCRAASKIPRSQDWSCGQFRGLRRTGVAGLRASWIDEQVFRVSALFRIMLFVLHFSALAPCSAQSDSRTRALRYLSRRAVQSVAAYPKLRALLAHRSV